MPRIHLLKAHGFKDWETYRQWQKRSASKEKETLRDAVRFGL